MISSRRSIFGLLASAPIAAKQAVSSAATVASAAAENVALGNAVAQSAVALETGVPSHLYLGILDNPKALALLKSGLAPDWIRREFSGLASERARLLSPDVASLRSVSLTSRFRIQQGRTETWLMREAEQLHVNRLVRAQFFGSRD